ncbi:MAG: poly-gamma-glutamate system protein [bacterium]
MRRRSGRINRWVITALALIALLMFYLETRSRHLIRSRLYEPKLKAAQLSARAFELVRNYRGNTIVLPVDSVNDPNGTGLIGLQYSPLTYGRSDLSDALTTTNPNFSAALVEMFHRLGLKTGDTVGINWDGTYPALNIQILATVWTLGLEPVIVTAQSSGMWGANCPGFTWLEIERMLSAAGLWDYQTVLATLGGEADDGRGLPPEGRAVLSAVAESLKIPLFIPASLSEALARREEIFRRCRVLVAVGLPVTNSGDPRRRLPTRLFTDRHDRLGTGLVARFVSFGRPVIHIAKPSRTALDYRLPVAPVPLPEIGRGRLFYERRYSVELALILALILIGLLVFIVRYNVESYFGVKSQEEGEAV